MTSPGCVATTSNCTRACHVLIVNLRANVRKTRYLEGATVLDVSTSETLGQSTLLVAGVLYICHWTRSQKGSWVNVTFSTQSETADFAPGAATWRLDQTFSPIRSYHVKT